MLMGLLGRVDGLIGIQRMGAGPRQNGKNRDNGKGDRPHEKFDFSGMTPFRHISRFSIRSSELSGKPESHYEDGNDDDQP